ncbi:MAG: exodeoxyribonuclease VII small subunit [Acidimicrobiia bacterium]|nr:exodeoxyribonuclease VII small subunit [Acidimicrobiia bacterium]
MPADSTEVTESSPATSGLRYGEALAELEELLDDLEEADIDVDRLAERVARGVELVRFCRDRLAVVTTDVDQVVADLLVIDGDDESANEGSTDEGASAAGDDGYDDANGGAGE